MVFLIGSYFRLLKRGFDHRIIPAITSAALARFKVIGLAESPPSVAAVLRALICNGGRPHRALKRLTRREFAMQAMWIRTGG